MTTPTICSVVPYTLTKEDSKKQNYRRGDALSRLQYNQHAGVQTHIGTVINEGDVFPLIIVRVLADNSVNGQVLLDGNDQLWVTSVKVGTGPGTFSCPDAPPPAGPVVASVEKSAAVPTTVEKSAAVPTTTTKTTSPKVPRKSSPAKKVASQRRTTR